MCIHTLGEVDIIMPHCYTLIANVLAEFDGNLLTTFKAVVKKLAYFLWMRYRIIIIININRHFKMLN